MGTFRWWSTVKASRTALTRSTRPSGVREPDVLSVLEDGCVGQTGHTEVRQCRAGHRVFCAATCRVSTLR
jgi:hypothetical protein